MENICKIKLWSIPICFWVILLGFVGCTKLVEVDAPLTSTNTDIVFGTDATAIAALNGIYTKMSQSGLTSGLNAMSLFPSLSADDLTLFNGETDEVYLSYFQNNLTSINTGGADFWTSIYSSYIFLANSAIEGLGASEKVSPSVKQQLIGEARFIRAFSYFYLVNLYGDVPLVLTTDYKSNSNIPRSKKIDVYTQIIEDLKMAYEMLSGNYRNRINLALSTERIAPNKWAAAAMLSRAYLYSEDFSNAELLATSVINNTVLYDTVSLDQVFLKDNKESIWQLQSTSNSITNTFEALYFILPITGPTYSNNVYISESLKHSFEGNDKRKLKWLDSVVVDGISYVYPFKYKVKELFSPVIECTVILRLAELYLIRAEARTQLGEFDGAAEDLNIVRKRAGLLPTVATTKSDLLNAILHERQVELFTEWGHRWLDLKRTGKADAILSSIKGSNWKSTDQLYPIPQSEIDRNPALKGGQNPGYN
jgi:hypothetical protein